MSSGLSMRKLVTRFWTPQDTMGKTCLQLLSSGPTPEEAPNLNAGIQAGGRHNRRQFHRLQMIPFDENSCRNRFLLSHKWELGPQTSFWIGRVTGNPEISVGNYKCSSPNFAHYLLLSFVVFSKSIDKNSYYESY